MSFAGLVRYIGESAENQRQFGYYYLMGRSSDQGLIRSLRILSEGYEDRALDIIELLGPVCALQAFGSSSEMRRRADELESTLELFSAVLRDTDKRMQDDLLGAAQVLQRVRLLSRRLEEAEGQLQATGWVFDPENGRVKRSGAANRPYGWRRKLVTTVAMSLDANGSLRNTADMRRKVARILSNLLPPEEVDPKKDGPIDRDLNNAITKRRT